MEDPTGDLSRIRNKWELEKGLKVAKYNSFLGNIHRCNFMEIQPGDFVDITVVADIASIRNPKGSRTECHFKLDSVIQLMAKQDVSYAS